MFLNKMPSGYTFTSAYYPSLCAVPGERVNGTETLVNLSNQLKAVVESTEASFQQKQEAVDALRTLQIPAATAALRRGLENKSAGIQLAASAAL
jgi:hypothetical protein